MYPREELTLLAARKASLRVRIQHERDNCAGDLTGLLRPLAWIDRLRAQWQALPAWVRAGAPVLLVALKYRRRRRKGRAHVVKSLLRWAPVAWRLWTGLRGAR